MKFAVLIATRNRPQQLNTLLGSLSKSVNRISQVTIVSSGENVSEIINNHRPYLPLTYFHSEISGQIAKKMKGIELISSKTDWVLFLDDDLVIPDDAIDNLIDNYLNNSKYEDVAGFGLNLNNIELRRQSRFMAFFLKLVGLHSDTPGIILKNGHAQRYLDSNNDIYTQWLNGLSVWRFNLLKNYNPKFSRIDYAAYEDVLFSYQISKQYKLLFTAGVYANNQQHEKYLSLSATQFKAAAYMRNLFVVENKELSKLLMLVAQFFRTLDFIRSGEPSRSLLYRTVCSVKILFDLLFTTLTRVEPLQLLTKRYN